MLDLSGEEKRNVESWEHKSLDLLYLKKYWTELLKKYPIGSIYEYKKNYAHEPIASHTTIILKYEIVLSISQFVIPNSFHMELSFEKLTSIKELNEYVEKNKKSHYLNTWQVSRYLLCPNNTVKQMAQDPKTKLTYFKCDNTIKQRLADASASQILMYNEQTKRYITILPGKTKKMTLDIMF